MLDSYRLYEKVALIKSRWVRRMRSWVSICTTTAGGAASDAVPAGSRGPHRPFRIAGAAGSRRGFPCT